MPKCIIHIGMHKTGSTSIQHSLGELNDGSFYYARIHRSPNQSVPVYSIFADDPMTHPLNRSRGYDENTVQDYVRRTTRNLKRSIRDAGERTLLISGEGIIKLKPNELKRMRRFLEKQGTEPEIVAYMRPPMAYMTSAFQQHVKSGNLHGLDLGNFYPRYQNRFEKFDEAFGRDKVRLWKFDPASFHEGSVVRDFCHRLGIDATALEEERKNESFSREMVAVVYQYRNWSAKSSKPRLNNRDAQSLVEFMKELPQTKLRFSPLLMAPILEEKKEDIAWAEARLGQSLAESLSDLRDNDVRGEEDLLAPVPGAADVLRAALEANLCDLVLFPLGPFVDPRYVTEILPLAKARGVGTVCFKTFGAGKLLGDTTGYNQPLQLRPRGKLSSGGADAYETVLPSLTVRECLHYTLTLDPDVTLLGLSFPNEQDAAFAAAAEFQPLTPAEMADIRTRAVAARQGKGPCWWNPDPAA